MESLLSLFCSWGSQVRNLLRGTQLGSCSRERCWSPKTSLQSLSTGSVWLFSSHNSDVLHQIETLYCAGWTKTFPDVSHLLSLMMYVIYRALRTYLRWAWFSDKSTYFNRIIFHSEFESENKMLVILLFISRILDLTFNFFFFICIHFMVVLRDKTKYWSRNKSFPSDRFQTGGTELKYSVLFSDKENQHIQIQ